MSDLTDVQRHYVTGLTVAATTFLALLGLSSLVLHDAWLMMAALATAGMTAAGYYMGLREAYPIASVLSGASWGFGLIGFGMALADAVAGL